jgi:hypothetical protein
MQADAQAVIEAFGKNEQVMRVCWMVSIAIAGLVVTKVLDPGVAQEVVGVLSQICKKIISQSFSCF